MILRFRFLVCVGTLLTLLAVGCRGPEAVVDWISDYPLPAPEIIESAAAKTPLPPSPEPPAEAKTLPINLATALQLAGAQPYEVALAAERVKAAAADLERAQVLWLPNLYVGTDYYRHDGQLQDVSGNVFATSKTTFMAGGGATAVFAVTDAVFKPLADRQVVRARQADFHAARNDSVLAVAEAYVNVQQARGELAATTDTARRMDELVQRTGKLAKTLAAPVDEVRARAEMARRRQALAAANERWQTASADLARLLRLAPATLVQPLEPPHLQVTLVPGERGVDELIAVALTGRPELASQQALVQATLERLRAERVRPLVPSVLLRGAATNPSGGLAAGVFGGGRNDRLADFNGRFDYDLQIVWELQNFGLGNRALVKERQAQNQLAIIDLFRLQDRIAAEVVQAHAQAKSAAARLKEAQAGLADAADSAKKHFDGLEQTQKIGNTLVLLVRPQEALASVQALQQAYADFYAAVADYDRAQFRLYRALGNPSQIVAGCP